MVIQPLGTSTQSLAQPTTGSTQGADRPAEAVAAVSQPRADGPAPSSRELKNAADAINKALERSDHNLRFSVDEGTGITVVKVVDANTGELIRQIPSDEVIAISR